MFFWRASAAQSTPFQASARTWRVLCSWEGWRATLSSAHAMTGDSMFEPAGSSMRRNLPSRCTPQSSKRANYRLASVEGNGMKKVTLYTLSTCPWCRKAKKFFADRNIPFTYIDFDLADETTQSRILQELDAAGATGFPFVKIGDEVVSGYQPERYASALRS